MRTAYRAGLLTPEEIAALETLPGWEWEPNNSAWNKQHEILVKFLSENYRYPTSRESNWVDKQRQRHKNGKLSKERIALLEALPGWTWELHNSAWDNQYQNLVKFLEEKDGVYPKDVRWIETQRTLYKNGKLSKERIGLLEALPDWVWEAKARNNAWDNQYQILVSFLEQSGGVYPREGETSSGWINRQRMAYKNGTLPKDRIRLLEGLPGWEWVGKPGPRTR